MKVYLPVFDHIFNRFSGKHKKPGEKNFMCVDEFEAFIYESGLINDSLAAREINSIFNLSMFSQVDEIEKGRHL
jgi:hypothetical protein